MAEISPAKISSQLRSPLPPPLAEGVLFCDRRLACQSADLWPLQRSHHFGALVPVGVTLMLLAVRPSLSDTYAVLIVSAVGATALLASSLASFTHGLGRLQAYDVTRQELWSKSVAENRVWSEFAASCATSAACLVFALPLVRNVATIQCRVASGPSMSTVSRRLSRLWLVWRGGNACVALWNVSILIITYVDPFSPLVDGDYYLLPDERVYHMTMLVSVLVCVWLPTHRARLHLSLLWLKSPLRRHAVGVTTTWLEINVPPVQADATASGMRSLETTTRMHATPQRSVGVQPTLRALRNYTPLVRGHQRAVDTEWKEHPLNLSKEITRRSPSRRMPVSSASAVLVRSLLESGLEGVWRSSNHSIPVLSRCGCFDGRRSCFFR